MWAKLPVRLEAKSTPHIPCSTLWGSIPLVHAPSLCTVARVFHPVLSERAAQKELCCVLSTVRATEGTLVHFYPLKRHKGQNVSWCIYCRCTLEVIVSHSVHCNTLEGTLTFLSICMCSIKGILMCFICLKAL